MHLQDDDDDEPEMTHRSNQDDPQITEKLHAS